MIELTIVFLLAVVSILERVRIKARAQADFKELIGESKPSMVSEAIANLVATAGGIYLSLMLLATFLGVDLPSTVRFWNLSIEPVAGMALGLALLQPFIQKIFNWLFK